jgi:hypothetical protein
MRHIFLFTITALFISGCVDLLPSKSNNSGAVVVNCLLNDDDVQKLKLTRTRNVEGSNGFDFITHAKAYLFELSESGSHLKGEFKFIGNGDYTLDYRPEPGKRYKLVVSTPEGEDLYAETQMPKAVIAMPISKHKLLYYWYREKKADGLIPDFEQYAEGVKKGIDMYILEKTLLKYPIWISLLTSNTLHENTLSSIPDDYKLSSKITGGNGTHRFSLFNKLNPGDSTDYNYWLYYTMELFEKSEISYHDWKFIFFRELDSTVMTAFSIKTLSSEYDTYLKSVMTKAWTFQDETGLSSMFDVSKIYTNINGGYGVFGAYSEELIFYNRGEFVNLYIAQSRRNILRSGITEYMKGIPWNEYAILNSLDFLISYIQWLDSEGL